MSWNPTHVVVAVQRAKDLISKGKHGTNDAFVTIALAGNKFQTTIKDKTIDPEWYEECDVPLPENYLESKITLQVFHRNNLGIDEFLGHMEIPLQNFDVYDPPRSIWYALACKPGQNKTKPRGELEIRLSFEAKKVKDLDTLSTASATSRRFKMSKKNLKSAAMGLGKKIKGNKHEKTTDYIPDLTGLDAGVLGGDEIMDQYMAPTPASTGSKKKTSSDSLSLPPTSPVFRRNPSLRSKGHSPFGKRRSRAGTDTPPSSNASTEDIRQRGEDSESLDGSFIKSHRRGGSGSEVVGGKPPKPNRRILVSKLKSKSNMDVSSAGVEPDDVNENSISDDVNSPRNQVSASNSLKPDSLAEVPEAKPDSINKSNSRNSSPAIGIKASKPKPAVLVDDDSDESEEYSPSPVVPVTIDKEEPTDLFARVDAQMQREEEDQFSFVQSGANPDDSVFVAPVDSMAKDEPTAAATSTPIVEEKSEKSKKAGKSKREPKTKPAHNVLDLLMASDEPEYNVDDTLPEADKADGKNLYKHEDNKNNNPFEESSDENPKGVDSANPFEDETQQSTNPFEVDDSEGKNPFHNHSSDNPFEDDQIVQPDASNPFEDATSDSSGFNPPPELKLPKLSNTPKSHTKDAPQPPSDQNAMSQNPFEDPISNNDSDVSGDKRLSVDDSSVSGFQRSGSSRFGQKSKQAKKGKGLAPCPPKSDSQGPDRHIDRQTAAKGQESSQVVSSMDKSVEIIVSASSSPKSRFGKEKKAPQAPVSESMAFRDMSRSTSESSVRHKPPADPKQKSRSGTHTGHVEQFVYKLDEPNTAEGKHLPNGPPPRKPERQPAIGAEAPDKPQEPKLTSEMGVQVTADGPENVPNEFRHMSKHQLVELVLKLRQQVRKKEDHVTELEEYIDNLLLRVMSTDPNLLIAQSACSEKSSKVGKLR